ncbi:GlsB/YeaQ/YmgE family stress response membrane protein [Macrococcus equi]|uniref:GlsB/YeaQ/YmgE family stress response membrane protein n=1 Tax=Macrococcus equi TaxID=3395462 RepID=UPI0039BDBF1E
MLELIITLIVGGLVGWVAGMIMGTDIPGGKIGNIIAGLIGAWIGGKLIPGFGPQWGDIHPIPALIGTILLIAILSIVLQMMHKRR